VTAAATPYARRLMLALDAGRCGAADLALAVELAAIIGAELEGLFVEDGELLDLALLPFAREVGGSSGRDRPLVRATMESLLRRRIERTVGELERVGQARHVPVSHTSARGRGVREALLKARSRDVLLFHPRAAVPALEARRAPGPVMLCSGMRTATRRRRRSTSPSNSRSGCARSSMSVIRPSASPPSAMCVPSSARGSRACRDAYGPVRCKARTPRG